MGQEGPNYGTVVSPRVFAQTWGGGRGFFPRAIGFPPPPPNNPHCVILVASQ